MKDAAIITFRASLADRRILGLLARAEGTSRSEAIRRAIRDRADRVSRRADPARASQNDAGERDAAA